MVGLVVTLDGGEELGGLDAVIREIVPLDWVVLALAVLCDCLVGLVDDALLLDAGAEVRDAVLDSCARSVVLVCPTSATVVVSSCIGVVTDATLCEDPEVCFIVDVGVLATEESGTGVGASGGDVAESCVGVVENTAVVVVSVRLLLLHRSSSQHFNLHELNKI